MLRKVARTAGVIAALAWAQISFAGAPTPAELSPMTFQTASLTVRGSDGGESVYSAESLEELPTYTLTTRTPWRDTAARFDGVLLVDLLQAHGLDGQDIIVTAENDFQVLMEAEVYREVPILVATRVDGRPHSRRERGPIQFVIDEEDFAAAGLREGYLVWMAARIEAAE